MSRIPHYYFEPGTAEFVVARIYDNCFTKFGYGDTLDTALTDSELSGEDHTYTETIRYRRTEKVAMVDGNPWQVYEVLQNESS